MTEREATRQVRSGPKPLTVVLWTLSAVFLVGVVFVGGLVLGIWIGAKGSSTTTQSVGSTGNSAGTGTGSTPGSGDSGSGAGTTAGTLDPCLVGTWTTTSHSESADTASGKLTITDLKRTLVITPDGTQTVTYDPSPATLTMDQGGGTAVFNGTVIYQVSTEGSTIHYTVLSAEGTVTLTVGEGDPQTQELKPGSDDVTYTCTDTTMTEESSGYKAVFTKAG